MSGTDALAFVGLGVLGVLAAVGIAYCVRSAAKSAAAPRDAGARAGAYTIPYVACIRGVRAGLAILIVSALVLLVLAVSVDRRLWAMDRRPALTRGRSFLVTVSIATRGGLPRLPLYSARTHHWVRGDRERRSSLERRGHRTGRRRERCVKARASRRATPGRNSADPTGATRTRDRRGSPATACAECVVLLELAQPLDRGLLGPQRSPQRASGRVVATHSVHPAARGRRR